MASIEEPSAEAILNEINGYTVDERKPVEMFTDLKDDGTTACGCWIYCGVYARARTKRPAASPARNRTGWRTSGAGPGRTDRRILYNRASADPEGKPWSERKKYVWWDEEQEEMDRFRYAGLHRGPPAFLSARRRMRKGKDTLSGIDPFVMQADGKAWLFSPTACRKARCPRTTSRSNRSFKNPLYGQQCNPVRIGL